MPQRPHQPQIILANGDCIRGTVLSGDTRSARFVLESTKDRKPIIWQVPITALAAVWSTPSPADTPINPVDYTWASGPKRRDSVLLQNGDVLRVTIEGFESDPLAVRIKSTGDQTASPVPFSRVTAIAFDPTLARVRKPKGQFARLVTSDGSRLTLATATADATTLKGTTAFGAAVELPLTDVIALDIYQGKATYLSDLKPRKATTEGYNGVTWPWMADRTVRGTNLRIGKQVFDKGLGTHSQTTLIYDLGGKYRRFEAVIGLDSITGRHGAADIQVLVDGRKVLASSLTGGMPPRDLTVDVLKAKQLTLIVDYGAGGDVQDDVDWGDARLIE